MKPPAIDAMPPEPPLAVADAARLVNLSPGYLYGAVARGELPHYRFGAAIRIYRPDLDAWVGRHRNGPITIQLRHLEAD